MKFGGGLPFQGRLLARLVVFGIFAASPVWPVVGANVTLAWNPNAESDIAGYKVYVGTSSRVYTVTIDAGNSTNQVVSNLVAGTTYYFAATAYNTSGLESDLSAEIVHTVPLGNSPPVISDIPNTNMAANSSLTISFTIGDNQTSAANLSLSGTSSNTTLLPNGNIVFGGAGSNRTVTVTPAANQAGSAAITITVSDGALSASDTFVLTVNSVNTPPTISDVADQTIDEDETTGALSFTVGDGETAAGSLTITRSSSNPALVPLSNIVLGGSGANRTATVTPSLNQSGTATITLNVSDGQLNASDTFVVTVNAVNDTPAISDIDNQTVNANTATPAIPFTIGDLETTAGSLTVSGTSSNQSLVADTNIVFGGSGRDRTVTVTPAANQAGSAAITVTVSDGALTASDTFVLTVNSVNTAPTISDVADQTIDEDEPTEALSFTVGDGETAPGSLAVTRGSSNPALVPLSNIVLGGTGTNRTVTVTPAVNQSGAATITLNVSDGQFNASDTFVVAVNAVNDTPVISDISNRTVNVNTATPAIPLTVGDVETAAGSLIVSGTSSNQNLVADTNIVFGGSGSNRTITVTPATNQTGIAAITITVSDGALSASDTFVLTVNSVTNTPPTISDIAARTIQEDTSTGTIPFTIADAEASPGTLTLGKSSSNTSLVPLSNIVFGGSGSNRTVIVTPVANGSGTVTISITVSDGQLSATDSFLLTVNAVNDRPTISNIPDQTTSAGTTAGPIPFTVSDVDMAAASLIVAGSSSNQTLVPNANIVFGGSGGNRTVSVTPAAGQTGTATIRVSVSDGALGTSDTFLLTVTSGSGSSNSANTVSFTNASAIVIPELGVATPYPSSINVTGLNGTISNLTVTLNDFTHTYPADVDVLLVGPTGQKVMLMSDVGGGYPVSGVDLTFSGSTSSSLPQSTMLTSGLFRPTDVAPGETVPAPAPPGPYATALSAFNGSAANGTWALYIVDDGPLDEGSSAEGWSLAITTMAGTSAPPTITDIPNQSTTVDTSTGAIPFTISDTDTPSNSLTLAGSSSNPTLVPNTNIVFGGSGTNRTVTLMPAAGQSGLANVTVTVSDGVSSASDTFAFTVGSLSAVSLTNAAAVAIPDLGAATPYPSTINVSGLAGTIGNLTVKLNAFSHTYPADLDVLLVGPTGQKVLLMSDTGGGYAVNGVNLMFSDAAAGRLPQSTTLVSGAFRPTDFESGDAMPAPAPAGPYTTTLSAFNGLTANGTWSLYVLDDGPRDQGSFAGGWSLDITTAGVDSNISALASFSTRLEQLPLLPTASASPEILSIRITNDVAVITWSAVPGLRYTLEHRDDLRSGSWVALPPMVATSPTATAAHPVAGSSRRFYRVRLAP